MPKQGAATRHSPFVIAELNRRREQRENRVADAITSFAGSMKFVYLHILIFAVWMLVFEQSPWPTLTLAVSLEAIFLSTFVMIGQNRQSAFQQAKADHDFETAEHGIEDIRRIVNALHEAFAQGDGPTDGRGPSDA
jgi:uncharacterized membrane protein